MKNLKFIITLSLLSFFEKTFCLPIIGGRSFPKTVFIPRSTGANTARELLAWQPLIHIYPNCDLYITGAAAFEYQESINDAHLAQSLFGTNNLSFIGSQVLNRETLSPINNGICPADSACPNMTCNFVADQFGLSTQANTSLALHPKIKNYTFDLELYVALNHWAEGLYLRFNIPITHTKWSLICDEDCFSICNSSCESSCSDQICCANSFIPGEDFPPCYMATPTVVPLQNLCQALSGASFGDRTKIWRFGKFPFCTKDLTREADVDLIVGYDFLRTECSHFGLFLQAVAPTGNRPCPEFLFSPIVGNGHHWEFGAGLSGHFLLWEHDCNKSFSIWFEGNITHMFRDLQIRSFDLLNGPMSRYLLLKEFDSAGQYDGNLITAVDFLTRQVDVKRNVKGDATVKFEFKYCNWSFDLGYNIYGHSEETISCLTNLTFPCDSNLASRKFGLKGTEGVCCTTFTIAFDAITDERTLIAADGTAPLNSTQSKATICFATTSNDVDNATTTEDLTSIPPTTCLTWDSTKNIGDSYIFNNGTTNISGIIVAQESIRNGILDPSLINDSDIDIGSGLASAQVTHKVFGQITYILNDCNFKPFFSAGASAEFAQVDSSKIGLSQWGILLKTGFNY